MTKKGKILARTTGQQHRHATSRSGQDRLAKGRTAEWPISNKDRARFITK